MDLVSAIEAFNTASDPKIELRGTFRDGHFEARLPRVGRTIHVKVGITGKFEPTPQDLAWLCQEARRAADPGLALLAAALDALGEAGGGAGTNEG